MRADTLENPHFSILLVSQCKITEYNIRICLLPHSFVQVFTSPLSPLSRKAVAMLFWTALIQACRSFSESACIMQLLQGHTDITQQLSA